MLERVSSAQSNTGDCIARARAVAPLIAAHAARGDHEREIAPEVLTALHDAQLMRMLLPRSCGGLETDPLTFVQAVEEIAKADGSTAWCVVQASGCSMSAAYLAPEVAREIFSPERAVLAWGPFGPEGRVVPVEGAIAPPAPGASRAASSMRPGSAVTVRCMSRTARRASCPTAIRPNAPCCFPSAAPTLATSGR